VNQPKEKPVDQATKTIATKLPEIIDRAQANLRELAQETACLPNGENGEFNSYLEDIASELEAFADQVEMLAGDEGRVIEDLEDYKLEAD
jgi:hypothetical protein